MDLQSIYRQFQSPAPGETGAFVLTTMGGMSENPLSSQVFLMYF